LINSVHKPRVPSPDEFPAGTRFVVYEFDLPLACIPENGLAKWISWLSGLPRPFDPSSLKVDNNWPADSYEAWAALIDASIQRATSRSRP
jgi:hypothetical protein